MSSAGEALVVNGWTVFAHPLFVAQLQALTDQVAALTQERDSLKSRLSAARARVDALLERLPAAAPAAVTKEAE